MIAFGAHAEGVGEGLGAPGLDHEFLEVDGVVGVFAAVEDVHHGDGEDLGGGATEVTIKRQAGGFRGCLGGGHGDAEDGVGAELGFVFGAVEFDHEVIEFFLVAGVLSEDGGGDFFVDVVDGFEGAFAAVAFGVVVAEFHGFIFAGGGAGGDGGAAEGAVFEDDIDFDGGVSAGVEDFACEDVFDGKAHERLQKAGEGARAGVGTKGGNDSRIVGGRQAALGDGVG